MVTAAETSRATRSRWLLTPRARKGALVVHVISSVGWIGVDLCLLGLAVTALTTADVRLGQSAVLTMAVLATWITVPLSLLALVTGIVLSVGTRWGLFRYTWVVVSLVLTALMVVLVNLALAPGLRGSADQVLAAPVTAGVADVLGSQRFQLAVPPVVALTLLCFVATINVVKPWGRTRRSR